MSINNFFFVNPLMIKKISGLTLCPLVHTYFTECSTLLTFCRNYVTSPNIEAECWVSKQV